MKKLFYITLLFLLTSCIFSRSEPSNFYNLVPVYDSSVKINNRKKLNIAIDIVIIPDYLNRSQIVTFLDNESKLNVSEQNRWVEPLSRSMQRVLADDISYYLKNSNVVPLNANRNNFEYIVTVSINRFYGSFNDRAILDIWWTITDKNNSTITNKRSIIEADLGGDYEELIKQQSTLVNKLSIEIANKINSL